MNFLELIGVIGFGLAIAAALDYMVKPTLKNRFAHSIRSFGASDPTISFGISNYLDRFFGVRLALSRAFLLSIFLSLLSLAFTYAFAYFTSDNDLVNIFVSNPSWMSVWLFLLFLSGCLIGDFLSFAQTRVFLRSVDGSRQGVVSVGLALSDAIISLATFVGAFTIIRLIAYLVIIGASTQGPIQQVQRLNTAAISYAIRSSIADGLVTPVEVEWSSYIASISSAKDASRFDEINR